MSKEKYNDILKCFIGFGLSAVFLTFAQPPFQIVTLSWFGYVPLIFAAFSTDKKRVLFFSSWIIASLYWLGNLYWMGFVTLPGWLAFSIYTGLLWPVLVFTLRWMRDKKVPLLIAVPVLIVGIESLQGFTLGGFKWRYLAHCHFHDRKLIQICDIFGAGGVSFLIAMASAVAYQTLANVIKKKVAVSNIVSILIFCGLLVGTIIYGNQRIEQAEKTIEPGPVIAAIQSNLPQSAKDDETFEVNKEIFQNNLGLSNKCIEAGAELVVWPETIIPAILKKSIIPRLKQEYMERSIYFDELLVRHSSKGAYVLVGSNNAKVEYQHEIPMLRLLNSAFLYEPDGRQSREIYSKIHLVPFGESVPFRESAPWLYSILMKFSPYDFDYNILAGDEYTIFNIHSEEKNKDYTFGVMICFESTIPKIAKNFTLDDEGKKKVDWLVNISNDGWFIGPKKVFSSRIGRFILTLLWQEGPSTELMQHNIASVFRAVENRISILRSVNTGISCIVDPTGRIHNGYMAGDLPEKAVSRQGVEGFFCDRVKIDSRTTIFSKYGQWLDLSCQIIVFSVLFLLIFGPIFRNISRKAGRNARTKN